VCFVIRKTTSKQERVILTTLYIANLKNTDKIITRGSLTVDRPPRCLVVRSFVHLLGSMYGFSNGPPMTKRPLVGAAGSPRAHRPLQFVRGSVKTRAHDGVWFCHTPVLNE
jgi:hypothetical protein